MKQLKNILSEDLRKWFGKGGEGSTTGGGWDRYNSKGEKAGKCGDSEKGDSYAACLSKEKAAKLGKDGIAAFVKRKRSAQSKAGDSKKGGEQSKGQKPTFVKTGASEQKQITMKLEEKLNLFLEKNCPTDPGKWSASKAAAKSKFDVYPSAYANGWAAKNYKKKGGGWKTCNENDTNGLCEDCWDGYKQVGMKDNGSGKQVPNCVPVNEDINSDDDVNYGRVEPEEYDVDNYDDYEDFIKYMRIYNKELSEATCPCMMEAEYQGRNVPLGKPMRGDVKKFKVYVKNPQGNIVKVNFGHGGSSAASKGEKTMRIRKSNPNARKSFRARHNCDTPGPRTKARYWSCRKW